MCLWAFVGVIGDGGRSDVRGGERRGYLMLEPSLRAWPSQAKKQRATMMNDMAKGYLWVMNGWMV